MSDVKVIVLLAFVLMCAPLSAQTVRQKQAASSAPPRLSNVIEVVRPSITQITRIFRLPPAERESLHLQSDRLVLGTGFIVDVANGYVITALHVIQDGENPILLPNGQPSHPERDEMRIGIAMPNVESKMLTITAAFSVVGFKVIARDERHDLALLKTTGQIQEVRFLQTPTQEIRVHPKVATLFLGLLSDGDAIALSGYPLNSSVLLTTSGAIASSAAVDIKEIHRPGQPSGFTWPDIADSYVADIHVNPGNSGGPMYLTASGAVIGVCVNFQSAPVMTVVNGKQLPVRGPNGEPVLYNSGLGVVVPARYVAELLKQNGVSFSSTELHDRMSGSRR